MKLIKLSLATALCTTALMAGNTTINGKLTGYYITDDLTEEMFGDHHQLAFGATLDVTHTFNEWVSANFSALGYTNKLGQDDTTWGYFEGQHHGAIFNVANLTASYADTTFVAGRQLLGTPMLQGYDWLLAPGSFEAYTVVNSSIKNVTLVASYVDKWRGNNTGEFGKRLTDNNFAVGATYDDKTISGNIWYYNVDAANYTQIYADAGYNFGAFVVAGQYVATDYEDSTVDDATAFGLMASTSIANIDLSFGYNYLADNGTGYIGWNALYTNQWNSSVADQLVGTEINAFKIGAATTIMGVSADVSYANYENDRYEANMILGYDITKEIDAGIVYSNYQTTVTGDETSNQFELYANYKF